MYVITITTESLSDVDIIKDVLENASEEGEITEPFDLHLNETNE